MSDGYRRKQPAEAIIGVVAFGSYVCYAIARQFSEVQLGGTM